MSPSIFSKLPHRQHRGNNSPSSDILPRFTSTLPEPISCDKSFRSDKVDLLPPDDPLRVVIERVKRPLESASPSSGLSLVFLDIELMAEYKARCLSGEIDLGKFSNATENEYAILYAKYPDNINELNGIDCRLRLSLEGIKGHFQAILKHQTDRAKPDYLQKRETLKNIYLEYKQFCEGKRVPVGMVEKGLTLEDTLTRAKCLVPVSLSIVNAKKPLLSLGHKKKTLWMFGRQVGVWREEEDRWDVLLEMEAARVILSGNDQLMLSCPHLGLVRNYRVIEENVSKTNNFLKVLPERLGILREDAKMVGGLDVGVNTAGPSEPPSPDNLYKNIVNWPDSAIAQSDTDTQLQALMHRIQFVPGKLYQFKDSSWHKNCDAEVSIELSASSDPLLVVRTKDTHVVRLTTKIKDAMVDLFLPQHSFSLLDHSSLLYQVKFTDKDKIYAFRELLEYVRIKWEENDEWRRVDKFSHSVFCHVQECILTGNKVGLDQKVEEVKCKPGFLTLFSSGKFEYNQPDTMTIGWICDLVDGLDDTSVTVHGAILERHAIRWGTLTFQMLNQTSAILLQDTIKRCHFDHSLDLINLLDPIYTVHTGAIQSNAKIEGKSIFDDDLMLSDIFTNSENAGSAKAKVRFEDTLVGRLWTYGLFTF